MPATSKAQQRFFGMVHACQKYGKCASKKVRDTANKIADKDAEDFARTSHEDLPEKKENSQFSSWCDWREQVSATWDVKLLPGG